MVPALGNLEPRAGRQGVVGLAVVGGTIGDQDHAAANHGQDVLLDQCGRALVDADAEQSGCAATTLAMSAARPRASTCWSIAAFLT